MCLAADDKYIIYGSKDRTAAVHDRRAGKNLKRIQVRANTQTHRLNFAFLFELS